MTPDALGIPGLTIGSVIISCVIAAFGSAGLLSVWVRGMPDRKRAETENDVAVRSANEAQFDRLEREIARLTAKDLARDAKERAQDKKIAAQGDRIDKLEHDLLECERKHAEAETEIQRLKNLADVLGTGRQVEQLHQSGGRVRRLSAVTKGQE